MQAPKTTTNHWPTYQLKTSQSNSKSRPNLPTYWGHSHSCSYCILLAIGAIQASAVLRRLGEDRQERDKTTSDNVDLLGIPVTDVG